MIEAFPEETAPRYLLRDRDAIYGEAFTRCVDHMGIREVLTAPRAPWQNLCLLLIPSASSTLNGRPA